jgi:hypothetical protein
VGAGDGEVTPAPGVAPRLAAGPSTPAGADVDAQLAQARELEAKLAEEYRTVRLLRASMAGEASARGERARELGKQARDRINAQDNRGRHKISPPWEGPYVVVKVLKPGTYKLANKDGEELTNAWNIQQLRRFYL